MCSGHTGVRGLEAERPAVSQSDRQWDDARLESIPLSDQRAPAHRATELSRIHHRRTRRLQRY